MYMQKSLRICHPYELVDINEVEPTRFSMSSLSKSVSTHNDCIYSVHFAPGIDVDKTNFLYMYAWVMDLSDLS